jgi:hypothetical protein
MYWSCVRSMNIHKQLRKAHEQRPVTHQILMVTSMALASLMDLNRTRIVRSCLSLGLHLLVLYDPGPLGEELPAGHLPAKVSAVNLYAAVPALSLYSEHDLPIERFYAWRGTKEPFETHSLTMQTAKLLIRKVAAIHYTLGRYQSSPDTVVVWADTDVLMLRPFDDLFVDFVGRYDVTYVPFTGPGRWSPAFTGNGFLDDGWRIESGMMTFFSNERSLAFTAAALEMYEGGMLRLLMACDGRKDRCPR